MTYESDTFDDMSLELSNIICAVSRPRGASRAPRMRARFLSCTQHAPFESLLARESMASRR